MRLPFAGEQVHINPAEAALLAAGLVTLILWAALLS